ncbi:MAG: dihydrofolate reductase family protein [Pseudonocardia sp.]
MRRTVNSTFISLDGVLEHMEKWHFDYIDDSTNEIVTNLIRRCDAALFGRRTYEIYAAHWPGQTGEFADRLNEIHKYVASTTLTTAGWADSTILKGDLVDAVAELKDQPGGDILMNGIGPVARTLLRHGLLDELHLWVHPVLAATGGPGDLLFRVGDTTPLHLVDTTPLDNGVVILTYHTAS